MSQSDKECDLRVEIQKLLGQINEDMKQVKTELSLVNQMIEENASLPATVKLVNAKLRIAARDAKINIDELLSDDDDDDDNDGENVHVEGQEASEAEKSDEEDQSQSQAEAIAKVSEKVTQKAKRTLRK